jgi:hypothetical protein
MGERGNSIDSDLAAWIGRQRLFFVATAPSGNGGRVNLSPKGLDTFAILDQWSVAYLDLTGSGVETIAHVRDNGRITMAAWAEHKGEDGLRAYRARKNAHSIDALPGLCHLDAVAEEEPA